MAEVATDAVIRKTQGMCPTCLHVTPAELREEAGKIWLIKTCKEHGESRTFLSDHPAYYRDLNRFYFSVMDRGHDQRDYILRLTERCNLDCPICLAGANQDLLPDFSTEEIQRLTRRLRKKKMDLMGCEPTEMESLPEILKHMHRAGNISALHTNGVHLADLDYARKLKAAGMDEVHLQFDGFDDEAYKIIRGEPLLENKRKTLENLETLDIAVDLVMTILAGVNEKEIRPVLEFGAQHPNIKEVFFLGCRMLGRAVGKFESSQLLPDQVIDLVAAATDDRVSRERVRRFQKLYFTFLSIFKVRKCFYIQHYLLLRDGKGGVETLDDVIDMTKMETLCERYRERHARGSRLAAIAFFLGSIPLFLNLKAIKLVREFMVLSLLMKFGFNLRRVRKRSILLGFITACDPLIYDVAVAENCGKGEISRDLGVQECGALANVMREHRWRKT